MSAMNPASGTRLASNARLASFIGPVKPDSIHRSTSIGRKRKSRLESLTARSRPRLTSSSMNLSLIARKLESSRLVRGLPACAGVGCAVL